ncbi:MAG: DNA primase catalytic subunit PriS [Candidatus Thermoplasmatota archaeon]|nr:DNA primase catalytic subunit PriS [Candidatus Thermoplasmatota archaeon]
MTTWLQEQFRRYYTRPRIRFPDRFPRREYALVPFEEQHMQRHLAVKTREDLQSLLERRVPAHIYYSSAYYETPDAPTMAEKGWMGADLIFDLDADHLPGAGGMSYPEMLAAVKQEMIKLLDFLQEDFGFEEADLAVYFSGGRGYHCHVTDARVQTLGSQERREIVDYITGRGLDTQSLLQEKTVYRQGNITQTSLEMPLPDEPGWRGKISREIIRFFQSLLDAPEEEALQQLTQFEGIGPKTARTIYQGLTPQRIQRMRQGKFDQFPYIKKMAPHLIRRSAVELRGEPDEPVTADVKRLIRLPGSLHGKTGLRVEHVPLGYIDQFDPLVDAVVFDDSPVALTLKKGTAISMKNRSFDLQPGSHTVPAHLAVLLVGRGLATVDS